MTSVYNLPGLMSCMMAYALLAAKTIYQSSLNKKIFFTPSALVSLQASYDLLFLDRI